MAWTDNLNGSFAQRLQAFFNAAQQSGFNIRPGSGYRSFEEQQRLYNDYKNGVPGQARAAAPGKSKHNHGLAMDLDYSGGDRDALVRWAHANAARFGLYFPMDDEDWHIQPIEDWNGEIIEGGGQMSPGSYRGQLMAAGIDPRDEMSNRMFSIMRLLVGEDTGGYIEPQLDNLMFDDVVPGEMSEEQRLAGKQAQVAQDAAARYLNGQSPGMARSGVGMTGSDIDRFMRAVSGQESGGDYNITNPDSGAHGRWQIMPSNWSPWAQEAGLGPNAPQTPHNQEIVVRHKMLQYYNMFGNWRDVAVAWYSGPGNIAKKRYSRKKQGKYPSISEYADQVMSRMG